MPDRETDRGGASAVTRLRVQGMDCASCAIKTENALTRMPGVQSVDVSVSRGTVVVKHDKTDPGEMTDKISALGYTVAASGPMLDVAGVDAELLTSGNTVSFNIFVPNTSNPASTNRYTGAALIAGGGGRETVTLAPHGDNSLKAMRRAP